MGRAFPVTSKLKNMTRSAWCPTSGMSFPVIGNMYENPEFFPSLLAVMSFRTIS